MKIRITKKVTKSIKTLMVCALSVILMAPTVFAMTQSSPYTATVYGKDYSFTSEVWVRYLNPTTVEAVAPVKANTNVPTGYMGGQARLFTSSGTLKASSSMTYNDSSISAYFVYSPRISTYGQYYSQSVAQFYNGNGYTSYTGYKSPIQALASTTLSSTNETSEDITETSEDINEAMLQTEYDVNSNGETYGSALSEYTIGVEPDLISAVGTNGVNGYVRANDLTPKFTSTKEAIKHNSKNGEICTISLYDESGTTVLGEFELITNYNEEK